MKVLIALATIYGPRLIAGLEGTPIETAMALSQMISIPKQEPSRNLGIGSLRYRNKMEWRLEKSYFNRLIQRNSRIVFGGIFSFS